MTNMSSNNGGFANADTNMTIHNLGDECRAAKSASGIGRTLAINLMGGKNANPNVKQSAALALRLELLLRAIEIALPALQKAKLTRPSIPSVVGDRDLGAVLSSASRDAKYLKHLTQGGIAMNRNVQEPLRVVQELRHKLALIQKLRPDLQGESAFRLTPAGATPRTSRHEKIMDELFASGEARAIEAPHDTEFRVVPFASVLAGMKADILLNLPQSGGDETGQRAVIQG